MEKDDDFYELTPEMLAELYQLKKFEELAKKVIEKAKAE